MSNRIYRLIGISLLLFCMVIQPAQPVLASEAIGIVLNGQKQYYQEQPFMENGRVLLPMRALFVALGAEVQWESLTRTAVGTRGETQIRVPIGSTTAYRNDQPVLLDVPATIIEGRTYVPVRFVAEAFGDMVDWNNPTRTVWIRSNWPDLRLRLSVEEIIVKAGPAVVHVENYDSGGSLRRFGSGFLVGDSNLVVTNYHVIEGAHRVGLYVTGGDFHRLDRLVYADPLRDFAVFQIYETAVKPILFPRMPGVTRGEQVVVMGSPVGLPDPNTIGIVTMSSRLVNGQLFIQTDAPIGPGHSGSPLLNSYGEVIGIITAQLLYEENVNLAIPISEIRNFISPGPEILLSALPRTAVEYLQ